MNFEQAIGLKHLETEHSLYYGTIVNKLGYDNVKNIILKKFTLEQLKKAYKTDIHFNNLPIKQWDLMSGFNWNQKGKINLSCKEACIGSELTRLYWSKLKVNQFSNCDGVCILKECARLMVEYSLEANT